MVRPERRLDRRPRHVLIVLTVLLLAVAAGAASTLQIGAGRFDPRDASRLAAAVQVEELDPVS